MTETEFEYAQECLDKFEEYFNYVVDLLNEVIDVDSYSMAEEAMRRETLEYCCDRHNGQEANCIFNIYSCAGIRLCCCGEWTRRNNAFDIIDEISEQFNEHPPLRDHTLGVIDIGRKMLRIIRRELINEEVTPDERELVDGDS